MSCYICENLEAGDTLYASSDWDGGLGFDYIRDIQYCPVCGRKLAEQTEPQYEMGMGTLKCDNCSEYGSYKCTKCDGEMYFKRLEVEDEPPTDCPWK